MNNNAFGTIAGLQKAHYGLIYGTTFPGTPDALINGPGYAEIAREPMATKVSASPPLTNCCQR